MRKNIWTEHIRALRRLWCMWCMWACGLNVLVDYCHVKTRDIQKGNVTTRRKIWTEHIRALRKLYSVCDACERVVWTFGWIIVMWKPVIYERELWQRGGRLELSTSVPSESYSECEACERVVWMFWWIIVMWKPMIYKRKCDNEEEDSNWAHPCPLKAIVYNVMHVSEWFECFGGLL